MQYLVPNPKSLSYQKKDRQRFDNIIYEVSVESNSEKLVND